jgi:hypothetical protein
MSQTILVEADSLEQAKRQLWLQIPKGLQFLSEEIVSDGMPKTVRGIAETPEAAFAKALGQVPLGSNIMKRQEIVAFHIRTISVDADNESEARVEAAAQISETETVSSLALSAPGRKGFLGIGKKPQRYKAQVLQPAIAEVTYAGRARLSVTVGHRNRGTRQDTFDMAKAYWMVRMSSKKKDPFVLYVFSSDQNARAALLDLPCIHEGDDKALCCSEVLTFGYYAAQVDGKEDGSYQAIICGDDLTYELWEQAKASFAKYGGQRKNDLEPTKHVASALEGEVPQPDKVVFGQETYGQNTQGVRVTYRVHKGPNVAAALAFLDVTQVTKPNYHVVVETPEGTYCRDINGYYKE